MYQRWRKKEDSESRGPWGGLGKGIDSDTINLVRDVAGAGAAGVAIGRRVWQAEDPQAVTAGIFQALFEG